MNSHIYPILSYADADAAVKFLEEAFGFETVSAHRDDEGLIQHAEMRFGDGMIMFGQSRPDSIERFGDRTGQGHVYVTVDDPDAHHDRAKAAGAEITTPLTDQDYGSRDYGANDPEGNQWSFGTYDPLAG